MGLNSVIIFLIDCIVYATSFAKELTKDPIEIGKLVPKIQSVEGLQKQYETKKLSALFDYIFR